MKIWYTRTQCSGMRSTTSVESGHKIKDTQYLYLLPKRPKLRRPHENQNDKGSLQKTRTGEAPPRAEKYGDLTTADHKVLSGGESRDNHRYAVVVQDLAAQWIQSYPRKTKTSHETERPTRCSTFPPAVAYE